MKPDRLESFVNENRHEFDRIEPSDQMWDAISNRLGEQAKQPGRKLGWMKAAAVVAVVVLGSALVHKSNLMNTSPVTQATTVDPEVQDLMEAEAFYAQEVSGKLAEIQKCYTIYPELKSEIEGDLNELESMYISLKKDLRENVSNKEVIEAMIENNRNRMKLVEDVLEQINC